MGCASSTPMVQTTGSEMLKAATHVATDATKTAEDAVEGVKDSIGKSLETAKDSVATTVESVKHEVENVVKEKSEMLDDAKNSLMEKLHLKQTENEGDGENSNKNGEHIGKTETDELKTKLNDVDSNEANTDSKEESITAKEIREHVLTRNNTETDSLKTSTPEPEIEEALAKSHANQEDEDDNAPTPKPTLSELENLSAEFLKLQQQQEGATMVNDIAISNDPLMSAMHENIKTLNNNSKADNNTKTKDNELTAEALTSNEIKSNNMHKTPQIPTAVQANPTTASANTDKPPPPLATAATANSAAGTTQSKVTKEKEDQAVAGKFKKIRKQKVKHNPETEEKRPGTTEWEKLADMLAQVRKFNPHDAFRRTGTFTKFGGGGFGQPKERSILGHHMDEDNSDAISNFRGSPGNSQGSSARESDRVQRLPNRPNTGNNRRNHNKVSKTRRNSNVGSNHGRKFDFNPTRSRVNEFVSSTPFMQTFLQTTNVATQIPYALSQSYESVKSPTNMRSHHSRNEIITLPPLESQERTRSRSQQHNAFDHNGSSMPLQNDFYSNETSLLTRPSSNTSLFSNSSSVDNVHDCKTNNLHVTPLPHNHPPVKNTSSFLSTPRSPFSIRKSYTDLYFSTTSNKENKPNAGPGLCSRDKSPHKIRKRCNVCCQKYLIK